MTIEEWAKDFKSFVNELQIPRDDYKGIIGYIDDAIVMLKEQEPRTGYWIESAGDDKCSVCGATYSDLYPDYQYTHYCPNCGAKMIIQEVKWE